MTCITLKDFKTSLNHLHDCLQLIPDIENLKLKIDVELTESNLTVSQILSYKFPKSAKKIILYIPKVKYIRQMLNKNFKVLDKGDNFVSFTEKSTGNIIEIFFDELN